MGPQFAFLSIKNNICNHAQVGLKQQQRKTLHIHSTILLYTRETIQKYTPYSVPPKINEEKLRKEIKNTKALKYKMYPLSMLAELAQ